MASCGHRRPHAVGPAGILRRYIKIVVNLMDDHAPMPANSGSGGANGGGQVVGCRAAPRRPPVDGALADRSNPGRRASSYSVQGFPRAAATQRRHGAGDRGIGAVA